MCKVRVINTLIASSLSFLWKKFEFRKEKTSVGELKLIYLIELRILQFLLIILIDLYKKIHFHIAIQSYKYTVGYFPVRYHIDSFIHRESGKHLRQQFAFFKKNIKDVLKIRNTLRRSRPKFVYFRKIIEIFLNCTILKKEQSASNFWNSTIYFLNI